MISFGIPNPHIKPVLYNSGYQLEWIEPHFPNLSGEVLNPDLQFFSVNDKNLLFVECKLGSFEHEQALRYKNLKKEDIIPANITQLEMSINNFEIIYCCDEENKAKLLKGEETYSYGFPIICCNDSNLTLEKNQINASNLKSIFSNPLPIPTKIPTEFYPYGPDDEIDYIAPAVFQSLLRLTGQGKEEISVEDIIKDSHPLYNSIHKNGKDKLKQKVGKIMSDLNQNEFKDVIKIFRNPNRYRINSRSYKKFRDLCLKLIGDYEKKRKQTLIPDF